MAEMEIDRLAKQLGPRREDVRRLLDIAARSADGTRLAKNLLRAKLRQAGVNPNDDDPFSVLTSAYDLGGDGVQVGRLADGHDLVWRHDEIPYSALFIGAPGFGKTNAVLHLLIQLSQYYTILISDLRGDYECLCRTIPGARLFVFGEFPINLLRGPARVPPSAFNQRFSETFTDQFDQYQSSRRYLNMVLDILEAKRVETGHWPCLLDLKDALEDRKEERGSAELDFRSRCLARVDAICRALGEKAVGVEQGIDLDALVEQGATLVFRMGLERSIQDFLTNWLLVFVFERRMASENKFNQKPILFVLDEQRSILRIRR